MLDAKDLRIGNLILVHNHYVATIERIGKDIGVKTYGEKISQIDYIELQYLTPIELTDEWLLRFGFERHELDNWFYLKIINDWTRLNININGSVCELSISNHGAVINVTYVHQLQNLYFALTGQELTLKQPSIPQ